MRTKLLSASVFLFALLCCFAPSYTHAINISVQFGPGTLFYSGIDPTAKATINAAAAHVSEAITSSLQPVTTDIYSGSYGSASATVDWNANYRDPYTNQLYEVSSATLAADTVNIYVGATSLTGNALGQGGPHIGFGFSVTAVPDWVLAVDDALSNSEAAYLRGGGPVMGTLSGSTTIAGVQGNYSADYGVSFGSLWFDNDEDNNGSADSLNSLDDYWHWNYTTPVPSGKNDLYSVAVHEILHVLGIGASNSWYSLVGGTTWNGSEVQSIVGSGANLIDPAGDHISANVMSRRISDGMPQEVVMDPNITEGSRKELTLVDLAFLRDIGYETIMPTFSSPPDFDNDGDVDGDDLMVIENALGIDASGDVDSDGDTDGNDFLLWQQQYTGPNPLVANVPEPTSVGLLSIACLMLGLPRRSKTQR